MANVYVKNMTACNDDVKEHHELSKMNILFSVAKCVRMVYVQGKPKCARVYENTQHLLSLTTRIIAKKPIQSVKNKAGYTLTRGVTP